MGGGGIIVIILIVAIVFGMQYCGNSGTEEPAFLLPDTTTSLPSASGGGQIASLPGAGSFSTSYAEIPQYSPVKSGQTWLVMLYQDADDKVLEQDIYLDVNEAEKAGATDRIKIVAQVDRYSGGYSGDGNWTGTKRFFLTQDDNLGTITSKEVADLGEVNMSSAQTLIDFVTWGIQSYPSDKYVLILSDHGMGWPGGWSDPVPKGSVDQSIPMQVRIGDMLYLNELDEALGQIRTRNKLDEFEIIGMDACLMGQLEAFTAMEPYSHYAVASEETEPALGWAYTQFLSELIQNPDMSGAELCRNIVDSYIEDDQRITDSSARADFLGTGSPFGGLFGQPSSQSPEQMAREIGRGTTLSAIDLTKIDSLNNSVNQLVYAFQKEDQKTIASSRAYAQNYTSVFGSEVPPSYIDLGNFLQIIKQKTIDPNLNNAADAVLTEIKHSVIAEKHGPNKPGSTGISIYFPNSQLYQNSVAGAESYTAIANRFSSRSLWDDFLAFHYSGRSFKVSDSMAVVPDSGSIRAPAAGGIEISAIRASGTEAAPGQPVRLSADISGENIGYIYLFVGYYDQEANSILVADQDYLESADTRQVNGVYYPDWGEGEFTLNFTWEPVVFAIDDGAGSYPACFKPEEYGRSYEQASYGVEGIYTYADSQEQRRARLVFVNGLLRQVFGFTGRRMPPRRERSLRQPETDLPS
jgi:hypothetical protein